MNRILTILLATAVILSACSHRTSQDFSEYRDMAYSDIISPLVVGYSTHWDEFSPKDCGLSDVYGYESPCASFANCDIDGDGSPELLIGDDFGDGKYLLYDIFTFDAKSGSAAHLLSGGERDSFTINGSGVICETGSNSAFESFVRYYKIENAALKEIEGPVTEDLMIPEFDKVLRYVAPTMYVAVGSDGELEGQLIKTFDDCYLIEVQDTVRIPKEGVEVQLWSAYDGRGVIYPISPGEYKVFAAGDIDSDTIGSIIYESGYVPDTYPCKGYAPGRFKIDFDGREGYVAESDFSWDYADRF